MSINSAMNAALSGLRAAARGTETVSNNISNALTPTYGRREVELSSQSHGMVGVRVSGMSRHMNEGVVADRRLADAGQQEAQSALTFFLAMEDIVGLAGDSTGISGRLADFEAGLIAAASRPDAIERLTDTVADARRLAERLNQAGDEVQDMRSAADRKIASDVETLNIALLQIEELNQQLVQSQTRSGGRESLLDQRQEVLDRIGAIVPIRVIPRDNDAVALYTEGGTILLDGSAATIGFDAQNVVTPFQTFAAGTLSGLTLNGTDIAVSKLGGGSLSGAFAVRDDFGVEAQTKLDALARDLMERFEDPAIDTTRGIGDPGLFTDAGIAFDAAAEVGLAQRISVNDIVNPAKGGESWRLRDGLGAVVPGPPGDATLLNGLRGAIQTSRTPASGDFGIGSFSASGLVSLLNGTLASARGNAEQELTFAASRLAELTELQASEGVDTDQELQNLLLLEQAYAANARILEAADDMLERLVRI